MTGLQWLSDEFQFKSDYLKSIANLYVDIQNVEGHFSISLNSRHLLTYIRQYFIALTDSHRKCKVITNDLTDYMNLLRK